MASRSNVVFTKSIANLSQRRSCRALSAQTNTVGPCWGWRRGGCLRLFLVDQFLVLRPSAALRQFPPPSPGSPQGTDDVGRAEFHLGGARASLRRHHPLADSL